MGVVFKQVYPNPGGRPVGAKNKLFQVADICGAINCNPFEILAQMAAGTLDVPEEQKKQITVRIRLEAAAELAQYLAPKLKAVEIKAQEESNFSMNINTKKCDCKSNAAPDASLSAPADELIS